MVGTSVLSVWVDEWQPGPRLSEAILVLPPTGPSRSHWDEQVWAEGTTQTQAPRLRPGSVQPHESWGSGVFSLCREEGALVPFWLCRAEGGVLGGPLHEPRVRVRPLEEQPSFLPGFHVGTVFWSCSCVC